MNFYETETPELDAKAASSRCAISAALASLLAYLIYLPLIFMLRKGNLNAEQQSNLLLLFNGVVIDLIAFPLAYSLLLRKMPVYEDASEPFSVSKYWFFLPCGIAVLYIGAFAGQLLNTVTERLTGFSLANVVDQAITGRNLLLTVALTVILAPVAEELFFRKLLIDRLASFSPRYAILFSALLFGLFHTNLIQFLYAFPLGLLLGVIYCKTRNIRYTILLHASINLIGGPLSQIMQLLMNTENEQLNWIPSAFSILLVTVVGFGAVRLIRFRHYFLSVPTGQVVRGRPFFWNWGFIVCCVLFLSLFVLSEILM